MKICTEQRKELVKMGLFAKIVGEWSDLLVSIDSDVFRKYRVNTQ